MIDPVTRILLVEDDPDIAVPLQRALERVGHAVEAVGDGEQALARAAEAPPDLVVLDLGLPGIDGVTVCERLRRADARLPVLMLTARTGETDEVVGLGAGADDYVTKPFRLAALLARIDALLRRAAATAATGPPARVEANGVVVDGRARRAWCDGEELQLTPKQFDLLALLVARAGETVRREELMDEVWDVNWFGSTKTLDVQVSGLRRKLGDDAERPRRLATVRGVGYRFERG
jgi:DNA-binding response OmpR family regulator